MTSDVQWQNYLSDVTDAVVSGHSVDRIRARYDLAQNEMDELVALIEHLNQAMPAISPRPAFRSRLKEDLLDLPREGVYWRIRRLPARVHFAAVAAIVGGFLLILQRILLGEGSISREKTNALREKH